MADIPVTIEEAEALEYARELLGRMRSENISVLGIEFAMFDPEAGRDFAREIAKRVAQHHPSNMTDIVEAALAGWRLGEEVVIEMIQELQDRRESLPASLAHYNSVILNERRKPKRQPAQRKESNFIRDIGIMILVLLIAERFQMRPTRNPSLSKKGSPSACSVVASAIGMTEPAVVSVWTRVSKQAGVKPLPVVGTPL